MKKKNWIIEGFPRTKIQALSLSKMGIIPDKIINIQTSEDVILAKIMKNLTEYHPKATLE